MDDTHSTIREPSLTSVVQEAIDKAQKTIDEQFTTLRRELKDELQEGREAAMEVGLGAGMGAVSGILLALMAVDLLHRLTRLPIWLCHGLVGGALGISGWQLVAHGASRVTHVGTAALGTMESRQQPAPSDASVGVPS